jgi:TRAP-type C4-dicarboxylate transport system permease small subunit
MLMQSSLVLLGNSLNLFIDRRNFQILVDVLISYIPRGIVSFSVAQRMFDMTVMVLFLLVFSYGGGRIMAQAVSRRHSNRGGPIKIRGTVPVRFVVGKM